MKRIERAEVILDYVRGIDATAGSWEFSKTPVGFQSYRRIEGPDGLWDAMIWYPPGQRVQPDPWPVISFGSRLHAPLANCLDVWVSGLGKVLSLEFEGVKLRLRTMRSGYWEAFFGLDGIRKRVPTAPA